MSQQTRFRRQESLILNAPGQKVIAKLGRGMLYRELALTLTGTFTYAAAANNIQTNLGRGDEWSIIQRVDIVANGNDIIRSFSGAQLLAMNRLIYGSNPRPSPQLGDGATVSPAVNSTLVIPFWMPLSARPMDTILDSSKLSDLRIEVTTNPLAQMNAANPPTSFNLNMDVSSYESFGIEGDFSTARWSVLSQVVPGVANQLDFDLDVGPIYRGFLIHTPTNANETTGDIPDAVSNIQLVSGTTIFRDHRLNTLRDWHAIRVGRTRQLVQTTQALAPVNGILTNLRKSANFLEDAWYFMDLCNDGFLAEGVDSNGLSELKLRFAVAAACTIEVIPIQVYPNRGAA